MATYLPNVKRYVSKTKSFTPDFKFLSDALDKRQDRYDTNYKKMNNLYGSVLHADLSRDDNMHIRDEYVKSLAPRIQQISGMDLSLQQNVDAAKGVFTPFFEDEKTVRDIVFTKRHQSEMQKFNQFKQSKDEKIRSKFWDGGIKMLNFSMADFKKANRDESMNVRLPELVENVDLVERGFNVLKESGFNVQDVSVSEDGRYMITQKNGVALTRRKAGKDPVTGDDIYYNPAQNYILQTMMDDPQIQRYYQTKFYVEAREWYEANAEQYGGEEGAKKAFAEQTIAKYKREVDEKLSEEDKELDNAVTGITAWEAYKQGKGNLIPGSKEMTTYERHLAEMEYLKRGHKQKRKRDGEILSESTDIDDLMYKAGNAYMSAFIDRDTRQAASNFANVNSERTVTEDKYSLQTHKSQLNRVEKEIDRVNKLNQTAFEKGYMSTENGFVPLPWAEGGSNTPGINYGGGNPYDQPVAGDALTTGEYAPDEVVDYIQDNTNTSNEGINSIKDNRFSIVEEYYSTISDQITSDDNPYSAEGMKVNGEFMTWGEAKEHYTKEGNGDALKTIYKNILNIAMSDVDDVAGPDLERSNPDLYNKIQDLNVEIDKTSTMLLTGWNEQTKVYNGVIEQMMATKEITMLEARMLEAYPLFNTRGVMSDPTMIQQRMVEDFGKYINGNSNMSPEDAAADFGFYSVEDMNNTIDGAKSGGVEVAESHFKNVFDEFWGKHSIEGLFTEVKEKMNTHMSKASTIPGVQNFNLKSHMTNQEQAGGGGTIYNLHPANYTHGAANTDANAQMLQIDKLLKTGTQNYTVMLGDMSSGLNLEGDPVEIVTNPGALLSLRKLIKDTDSRVPDGSFPKGKEPNFTVTWSERLGGSGDKSGWVIAYNEEYASTHKSTNATTNNNLVQTLPSNSITVFAPVEYADNNPKSVINSYVGTTEYLVNENKSRVITNDGGEVIFYKNSNNQMVYKARLASFDGNSESDTYGNIVYGSYSQPKILPPSSQEVDLVYNRFKLQLISNAADNQSAMEAHKKEIK
jgi:hypothetical protein